jgi:type VI secretion system secreted protein Hcp
MAIDAFLDIDGVEGESAIKGFEKKIQILDFSWGATQSATGHMGTGSGSGKANVQDIQFSKYLDKTTPTLLQDLLKGKHYKRIILTLRKVTGDVQLNYCVFTMEDAMMTSYSTGAGLGGDDQVREHLSINFARIRMEYTLQDSKGAAIGKNTASWDVSKGTTIT